MRPYFLNCYFKTEMLSEVSQKYRSEMNLKKMPASIEWEKSYYKKN